MDKNKTIYACSYCGAQSQKWLGRCLGCGKWGTLKESFIGDDSAKKETRAFDSSKIVDLDKVTGLNKLRLATGFDEIDNLLGGGLVEGSLILLGGEPGIGKSTIMLQLLKNLENQKAPTLYLSGEESASQIKLRAERLNYQPKNLKFLSETRIEEICSAISQIKPSLAIIDSIQTVYTGDSDAEAGSVNQIRACTVKLLEVAKSLNIPIIITGHVTKDGTVAGPKTLEHLVDVVIYLEGDKYHGYRVLRSIKNRFGSTNEIAIFAMTGTGLEEIKNPSEIFLERHSENISGTALSCFLQGTRVFLIEIQALVSPTLFGYPVRKTSGFDTNRLQLLAAVISKRTRVNLSNQDIHLNIVGGFKVDEPAVDLAAVCSIISAKLDKPISPDTIIIGEVGLGGEIRNVSNLEKRLQEAQKLGFKTAIIPETKLTKEFQLSLVKIKTLADLPLVK
jgi:DNA repair protein RadA/Sms